MPSGYRDSLPRRRACRPIGSTRQLHHAGLGQEGAGDISAMFVRQYAVDILTLRLGGVYGPGYRTYLSLVSRRVRAAVTGQEPDYSRDHGGVPVYEAGSDLAFVKDITAGIAAVQLPNERRHRIYNVGAGHAVAHGAVTPVERGT